MFQINPIETERLLLREITENDVEDVLEMRSDPEVMRYIPRPLAKTNEDALKHIRMIRQSIVKKESINWGIALKDTNRMIGFVGFVRMRPEDFRSELGYLLNKNYHRKGFMMEVLPPVLDYGFNTLGLHSIEAIIDPDNSASEQLLIRNGFVKEAHFKENCFFEGKFLDSIHYSLLKGSKK